VNVRVEFPMVPVSRTITRLYLPDYLILLFGHAKKYDLQRVSLSAVSTDGLYFETDVSVILINKTEHKPLCISDFENRIGVIDASAHQGGDKAILDYMCETLKSHNPNMTPSERMFLELYFEMLRAFMIDERRHDWRIANKARKQIGLDGNVLGYDKITDVWRALLPIPECQLYVNDPLAPSVNDQPDNNFRFDYGFWDGKKLIAVELDGAEPGGNAKDIRRDRLLQRAGVDVIHIHNTEIMQHRAQMLYEWLPRYFFGFNWNYPSKRPDFANDEIPF